MKLRRLAAAGIGCAVAAGCAQRPVAPAPPQGARAEVINTICPIGGDDFGARGAPPELTRTWRGKTIGFCCAACLPEFDRLGPAGKDQILALAEANRVSEYPPVDPGR
jgi:hypothetical protein